MSPARGRCTLDQFEPLGQENADQWPRGRRTEVVDRAAVDLDPLGLTRLEADLDAVRSLVVARVRDNTGHGSAPAHQLTLVRRAWRPCRAAEVERLQEVRLAGPVRTGHHRQAVGELECAVLVVAKVTQLDTGEDHGRPAYTFRRIGITR